MEYIEQMFGYLFGIMAWICLMAVVLSVTCFLVVGVLTHVHAMLNEYLEAVKGNNAHRND